MYIEEVILEGFKSYATRTSISGWDPEFNAITGLNGTGKSNILDAICFVLGLDNLRQVRATSLQDLVYKKGQAGITKAAVTVVFNNSDPTKSPIGFAECPQVTVARQIVLNGKNKYLINGHNAQQKAVENLFQSVQLNVNNPHFLIMQGQITRVLNMKPMETLALIEESAGTRMFEDRKSKAIGTMEKKERKVEEISALLGDTIEPKLNALKSERSEFLEYKRTESDLERLQRLLRAYEYTRDGQTLEKEQETLAEAKEQLASLTQQNRSNKLELETVNDEIFNVTKRKEKESKANGKVRALEEACREAAASMIKMQTLMDLKREVLAGEENRLASLRADLKGELGKLAKFTAALSKVEAKHKESDERHGKMAMELKRDEDLLRSLETGIATGDDSKETGYARLLRESRDKLSNAQVAVQQAQQRIKSLQSEMARLEKDVKAAQRDSQQSAGQMESLAKEVAALRSALGDGPEVRPDALFREQERLQGSASQLETQLADLRSATAGAEFLHSLSTNTPHGISPASVMGTVAKLVSVPQEKVHFCAALEVAAGGRLYNVVVSDEQTAATLLEHGKLARRVTFIPLSKIQCRTISAGAARLAEELTQGSAHLALSLIAYDGRVSKAMEYVFGSTFICETKEAAALIAFDKRLGYRAVTVEGDVYEPYGTLSGGAASTMSGMLKRLYEQRILAAELAELKAALASVSEQVAEYESRHRRLLQAEKEIQRGEQQLGILKRRFAVSDAGQLLEKYESLRGQLVAAEEEAAGNQKVIQDAQLDCAHYEGEHAELTANRDGKLASIKKQVQATRDALAKDEASYRKIAEEYRRIQNDKGSSLSLVKEFEHKEAVLRDEIKEIDSELTRLTSDHLQAMTCHNGLRVQLDTEMRSLRQFDAELVALETSKRELEEAIEGFALQKKQTDDTIAAAERSLGRSQERLDKLLAKNGWIRDFCSEFGKEGGSFDFGRHNMSEVAHHVRTLEGQRETLRKTINFNVIDMLDRVEAKDNALRHMLSTVKKDRTKIEGTIVKLNDYMLDTLSRTWKKVTTDFGQIFAELLPGGTARLDWLEGEPITSGLEIKVCLGGVWKQSLAELSGGQRSLIALSLILALLQYRPAPMYILDEVDAALDLSHTENIGRLLKSRFKGSQFIVVSLKEGMFNNANVLFRTRFRDGISGVERIANREASKGKLANEPNRKPALKLRKAAAVPPQVTAA